jgi:plastocyanin
VRRALLTLVALAALAFPAGAGAAPVATVTAVAGVSGSTVPDTSTSGASKGKAKKRALKRCRKINRRAKRKRCVRRIRKGFATPKVLPHGPIAATVDVRDKYFSPAIVNIRSGQSILWVWNAVNADAHNVNLVNHPKGIERLEFSTPNSPSVGFEFRRTFRVPGTYDFVCSIHYNMTMKVEVSG